VSCFIGGCYVIGEGERDSGGAHWCVVAEEMGTRGVQEI
jgi:hypothetical protein